MDHQFFPWHPSCKFDKNTKSRLHLDHSLQHHCVLTQLGNQTSLFSGTSSEGLEVYCVIMNSNAFFLLNIASIPFLYLHSAQLFFLLSPVNLEGPQFVLLRQLLEREKGENNYFAGDTPLAALHRIHLLISP
jgi:hypothetical protein